MTQILRAPDGSIEAIVNGPFTQRVLRGPDGRVIGLDGETVADALSGVVESLDVRVTTLETHEIDTGTVDERVDERTGELTRVVGELARRLDRLQRVIGGAQRSLDERERTRTSVDPDAIIKRIEARIELARRNLRTR